MSPAPEAVIFDLDDTLIDTSRVFFEARESFIAAMVGCGYAERLARHTFEATDERNLARFGYISERNLITMRECYEALLPTRDHPFSAAILQRIALIGVKCLYQLPRPFPYSRKLLTWCSRRYRMALLTRGSQALQNSKIEKLGVRRLFEKISVVERKDSKAFEQIVDFLKCRPEQCVSVGDSMRFDVLAAIEIGMSAIHVQYPLSHLQWKHDNVTAGEVHGKSLWKAASLHEAREILERFAERAGAGASTARPNRALQ